MSKESVKSALILFQKNLELGKAKTRIAKTVGDTVALEIYSYLIQYTHEVTRSLEVNKYIFYSDHLMNEKKSDFKESVQMGHGLGERMSNALSEIFELGYSKAILIGTDCGELTKEILEEAFLRLDESEVVIGPAKDGGYYLIGMKKLHIELFENMEWSTDQVANHTIDKLNYLNLDYSLLPKLSDVDTYDDWLEQLEHVKSVISL